MAKSKSKSKGSKTTVTAIKGSVIAKDDPFANLGMGELDFSKAKPASSGTTTQPTQTASSSSFYDSLQSNWERLRDYALDAIRNSAAHSVDNQNETSDAAQQNAYVSYMNGKKDLNDTLARQGITGGGSETTNLKADTDYQNNRGSIESLRSQAIQKINQQLESDIADKSVSMSESEMSALQNQYNTDTALAEQKKEHADSIS